MAYEPQTSTAEDAVERMRRRDRCREFLYHEAHLLDTFELEAWLEMLADGIHYEMPVRVTRAKGDGTSEFHTNSYHFNDDKSSLAKRVERFTKEYAWIENPRHRTRRLVGNVQIDAVEETDDGTARIALRNNLLVARSRGDEETLTVETATRHDVLRDDGSIELLERTIYLDQTVTGVLTTFY